MLRQPFSVRSVASWRNDLLLVEKLIVGKSLDCWAHFDLPLDGIYAKHTAIKKCVEIAAK